METIYLTDKDENALMFRRIAFPAYNGRKYALSIHDQGGMSLTSCWGGGSKNTFVVVRLADNGTVTIPDNGSGFTPDVPDQVEQSLPAPGFVVVEHSIFCGQDSGITIHVHRDNAAKLLPARAEISWAEQVVLAATRSLKSSYAGIKDYRLHEAKDRTGITSAEYAEAKAALIARKLLNSAGAITVDGKNAIGNTDLYRLKRTDVGFQAQA